VRRDAKVSVQMMDDGELREMFEYADEDGGGCIGMDEFVHLLGSTDEERAQQRRVMLERQRQSALQRAQDARGRGGGSQLAARSGSGAESRKRQKRRPDHLVLTEAVGKLVDGLGSKQSARGSLAPLGDRVVDAPQYRQALAHAGVALGERHVRLVLRCFSEEVSRGDRLSESAEEVFRALHSKDAAKRAFAQIDKDGNGSLSAQELSLGLQLLGLSLGADQVKVVINELDKDGDGEVDVDEFLEEVWRRKLQRLRAKFKAASYTSKGQDWRKLFQHYDRDNSGSLGWEEFRRAVRRDAKVSVQMMDDGELREMFEYADEDGGGCIGMDEFVHLLGSGGLSVEDFLSCVLRRQWVRLRKKFNNAACLYAGQGLATLFKGGVVARQQLDMAEFTRAVRQHAHVTEQMVSEPELRAMFEYTDYDDDGLVTLEDFVMLSSGEVSNPARLSGVAASRRRSQRGAGWSGGTASRLRGSGGDSGSGGGSSVMMEQLSPPVSTGLARLADHPPGGASASAADHGEVGCSSCVCCHRMDCTHTERSRCCGACVVSRGEHSVCLWVRGLAQAADVGDDAEGGLRRQLFTSAPPPTAVTVSTPFIARARTHARTHARMHATCRLAARGYVGWCLTEPRARRRAQLPHQRVARGSVVRSVGRPTPLSARAPATVKAVPCSLAPPARCVPHARGRPM
jgi:calcium-binding protein CML